MTTNHRVQNPTSETQQLEADIARQREELAETVQDLHDRLDVKTRAQERVEEMKGAAQHRAHELQQRATTADGRPRAQVLGIVGVALAAPVAVAVWSRWRAARHRSWWRRHV